jgi:hypothetical protein
MRATLQSASDRLHQLEKDNVDLARNFAELEKLRTMVRQKEARLCAKRIRRPRLTIGAPDHGSATFD